ncbi:DUF948 domain-containing protein [Paenibacillus taiwanensis]|uniref:DUF948 domain-containing protein n=1 Tax=Paenibacillus taiwanensis TaxID=401638 RepID=UPI00041E999E|nr:DUF948 domain-containing protein [Paenibacillus taiwanensis]
MILEISALIASLAFVVLVIFLIQTLVTAKRSLDRASATLEEVQRTVEALSGDLQAVARNANEMTAGIQQQVKKIEPLVDSIENIGEALNEVTAVARQVSVGLVNGVRKAATRFDTDKLKRKSRAQAAVPTDAAPDTGTSGVSGPAAAVDFALASAAVQAGAAESVHAAPETEAKMMMPLAIAEAAATNAANKPAPKGAAASSEAWKSWVDIGVQAWQLFRNSSK